MRHRVEAGSVHAALSSDPAFAVTRQHPDDHYMRALDAFGKRSGLLQPEQNLDDELDVAEKLVDLVEVEGEKHGCRVSQNLAAVAMLC